MRKEIQSLMSGKALSFMAAIAEKLDIKSAAEYEIEKIKVAKTLIKESSDGDDMDDLKEKKKKMMKEKLVGDQHKLDHDEDGDIDSDDMKALRKKGPNNDHPLAEDSMEGGGESLKPGQVVTTATSVKAKNKKGESRTWPWHPEYDENKHIDKTKWFAEKKQKALEFSRGS